MSPDFLYRIDLSTPASAAHSPSPTAGRRSRPLSGYALANRLSYFLWSSMPDEELLSTPRRAICAKPAVLLAQARRMLKDDRARGLATEFGGNWLDFRQFETINSVDRERFPSFNDICAKRCSRSPSGSSTT